ncbi:phosphatase PAP2 family protein [Kitasatospora sp. NBC_01266]|uniref:phosphatase PAP2 family protein n=1 Tax=Kitasatospora sp. NBC_01266 TaxID=2903572 RepID=UPI002E33704C|nr:phosphatase PAP2 family protein [Kitasatospora sp. NBC_01266]
MNPTTTPPPVGTPPQAGGESPTGTAAGGRFALLPARLIRQGRPAWWAELLLTAIGYALYTVSRNAVPDHRAAALHRAQELLDLERHLHLSFELSLNHAANHVTWLIVGMNYYYATLHFVMVIGTLLWLHLRRPDHYRAARTALYTATAGALVGFYAFALAPPRFLTGDGFIDTVVVHHTWGSWASGPVADASNQYAAMPSVHIAWSTWCAVVLYRLAKPRAVRVLAALYPVATCVVILSTANHFEADAVAGLLTIAAGFAVQRLLTGRPAFGARPGAAREGNSPAASADRPRGTE